MRRHSMLTRRRHEVSAPAETSFTAQIRAKSRAAPRHRPEGGAGTKHIVLAWLWLLLRFLSCAPASTRSARILRVLACSPLGCSLLVGFFFRHWGLDRTQRLREEAREDGKQYSVFFFFFWCCGPVESRLRRRLAGGCSTGTSLRVSRSGQNLLVAPSCASCVHRVCGPSPRTAPCTLFATASTGTPAGQTTDTIQD